MPQACSGPFELVLVRGPRGPLTGLEAWRHNRKVMPETVGLEASSQDSGPVLALGGPSRALPALPSTGVTDTNVLCLPGPGPGTSSTPVPEPYPGTAPVRTSDYVSPAGLTGPSRGPRGL